MQASGTPAKVFDTIHSFRVCMSHRWTHGAIQDLSKDAMQQVIKAAHQYLIFLSHDNVNVGFLAFEQRVDNQTRFESGCAANVYVLKQPTVFPNSAALHATRRASGLPPITSLEILMLDAKSSNRLHARAVHRVLRFLLESPEFNVKSYEYNDSDLLKGPPPVTELPSGSNHRAEQFMLQTKHMDEASYDGNMRLLDEWLRQLKLDSKADQMKLATDQIIPFVGDKLTVSRLRGLQHFRSQDHNGYDRFDWMVVLFGWFHLQMTFATSLFAQYLGTSSGSGLAQAFDLLKRKGLPSTSTKGPFHHNLEEALYHVSEAHFTDIWKKATGADQLSDLRQKDPRELLTIAERIVDRYACNEAVVSHQELPVAEQDEVFRTAIQWNRDVLEYLELDDAIQEGDLKSVCNTTQYHVDMVLLTVHRAETSSEHIVGL